MAEKTRPELTYSLEQFAKVGHDVIDMSYFSSSIHQQLQTIHYPLENVINDYIDQLKPSLFTFSITDNEYYKYRYKPDLLAFDFYGSIDLGFLVLMFNNCISDKEFTLESKRVILLKPADIYLINQILNCEKEYFEAYK